jgi:hypothetical protein
MEAVWRASGSVLGIAIDGWPDRARLGFLPLASAVLPMVTLFPDIAPRVSRLTWLGCGIIMLEYLRSLPR